MRFPAYIIPTLWLYTPALARQNPAPYRRPPRARDFRTPALIVHLPRRAADIPPAAIITDMGWLATSKAQSLAALATIPFSLVSWADIADQPYGAPRHTCVQNAGTNIVHLLVDGPAVLDAIPNIDSMSPAFGVAGLSASVEEHLKGWEMVVRRGVRERRGEV